VIDELGAALGASGPLRVVPTPDDHVRLSASQPWDEATRPLAPAADPDRAYTPREQAAGQHLVDVHDQLRGELRQIRDLVGQVIDGSKEPAAARSEINTMTMRQNNWTAGVYCAQYCRVLTMHHSLEDTALFTRLRRAEPALGPVVDRLMAEHRVIHDILEAVDVGLVALVSTTDGGQQLRETLDLLTDALLSHLSYEEHQLVEPLARSDLF
jgi:Hemerythrin HHE cation binding domain